MMNSNEIVAINLGAHLDTDIVLVVDIPGTGVADDLPILGLCDHRPGPKGFGQGRKSQRAVKTFTGFHHCKGRSEERRVGKEGGDTWSPRRWPEHTEKKNNKKK